MAKLTEVIEKRGSSIYKCELCKGIFPIKDIKLTDPIGRIEMYTHRSRYLFVNKEGEVMENTSPPSKDKGDRMLTCPLCGAQHPFGFVLAPDPRIVKTMGHA
jgi:hypothetical protein